MLAIAVYLVSGLALHHRLSALRPALQENICLHRRAAAPRCAADVRGDVQTQIQAALDADKVMAALDLPPPPPPPILAPPRSSRLECGAFALLFALATKLHVFSRFKNPLAKRAPKKCPHSLKLS